MTSDERRESILTAASSLVAEGGESAISMAALAEKTGLSRPALYQYFPSREHVLAEILIDDIADLSNELDRIIGDESSAITRIRLWVHFAMAHLASADHRITRKISQSEIPEDLRGLLRSMHGHFMSSLISSLNDLGVEDPPAFAHMVFATVSAAAERVDGGSDFASEARALEIFLGRALAFPTIPNA